MKYKKRRYILVYHEIHEDNKELERKIRDRIKDLFGAIGLQSIDFMLVKMENNFFIIRCNNNHVDELLFTLSSIKFKEFTFLPIRVSGTIKKLKKVMNDFIQIQKPLNSR
ncbi:MAG: Rpp14/Pop5 family protein [Nitrososphaerales archaeon]